MTVSSVYSLEYTGILGYFRLLMWDHNRTYIAKARAELLACSHIPEEKWQEPPSEVCAEQTQYKTRLKSGEVKSEPSAWNTPYIKQLTVTRHKPSACI